MVMLSGYEVGSINHNMVMRPIVPINGISLPPVKVAVANHFTPAKAMRGEIKALPEQFIQSTHIIEALDNNIGKIIGNRNTVYSANKLKQYSQARPITLPNANEMFDDVGNRIYNEVSKL